MGMKKAIDKDKRGRYIVHNIKGCGMTGQTEVDEIRGVYEKMDDVGKKEMLIMSKKFFEVQKIMDLEKASSAGINESSYSNESEIK
jgi:hypothetical protein